MKYSNTDMNISCIPDVLLYKREIKDFSPATIACFVMNDDWNEQRLSKLKEITGADLLVGLQTEDSEFEVLNIIDDIIRCQSDELKEVIKLLDAKAADTLIGIDIVDIISLFKCGNSFQFIQASATGESDLELVKIVTQQLVSQLAKVHHTKGLFIGIVSTESLSLNTLTYISEAVGNSLSVDNEIIHYSFSITDEPEFFGLKVICA